MNGHVRGVHKGAIAKKWNALSLVKRIISGIVAGIIVALIVPQAAAPVAILGSLFVRALQSVGVGFIIGVLQDSTETALNSSTDVLLTATAEFADWRKSGRDINYWRKAKKA